MIPASLLMLGLVPTDTFHKEMFIFLIFVKPFFFPRENCRQMSSRNLAIPMQSFILRFSIATAFYELRADFLDWTADCESRISCNSHAIHTIQGQFSAMPDCNHLTQSSTIQCNPTQLRWIEGGLRVFMRYQCNAGNQTVFEASTRVLSWKSKTHLLRSRNPSQSKGVILQSVPLYHNYKKG